jgi:hypothetical protein
MGPLLLTALLATSPPHIVERVGGPVSAPVVIKRIEVNIPPGARKHVFSGSLFIYEAVITERGDIEELKLLKAPEIRPPWPELLAAQRVAVLKWKFRPARRAGKPVAVFFNLAIEYYLQ